MFVVWMRYGPCPPCGWSWATSADHRLPPGSINRLAGWLVAGAYNNFWNGPAAVIVFFVVSGFCIHYPFSRTLRIPSLVGYATRRYLRIGIPLAVAVAVSPSLGVKLDLFHDSVLWSLAAELVYYTLYPALLALRRHGVTWRWMFASSFAVALLLAATDPIAKNYPSWGLGLNWILGLPCWLAGCELAERGTRSSAKTRCDLEVAARGMGDVCGSERSPVPFAPWVSLDLQPLRRAGGVLAQPGDQPVPGRASAQLARVGRSVELLALPRSRARERLRQHIRVAQPRPRAQLACADGPHSERELFVLSCCRVARPRRRSGSGPALAPGRGGLPPMNPLTSSPLTDFS